MQRILNRAVDVSKPKKNSDFVEKILYIIAVLSGLGLVCSIIGSIAVIIIATVFSSTLPSPGKLTNRQVQQSTKIYSKDNELLYSVYKNENRTLVALDQVSPFLVAATLSAEDGDFYEHQGLDIFGIIRSVYETVVLRNKQGGSTLTQQIAKNALLSQDRTLTRKIKDMVLALQIERAYTKDDILQIYLNEINYGGNSYGIEAASKTFFNKSAKDLTLAESAQLAGLPQRPGAYYPFSNPDAAKARQKYVLKLMHENGWIDKTGKHNKISDDDYKKALDEKLEYNQIKGTIRAPHFVFYVLDQLRERYGDDMVENGGLTVTTTLDLKLQDEYQKIVAEEVARHKPYNVGNGGLIALEPKTRKLLAMIGSKDYFAKDIDGQWNVTYNGKRQPGSTLKPITYLTGFTKGYTASSVMYDVKTEFINPDDPTQKPYAPNNYGNWGFHGPIQVRYALANSVNVPAVKMLDLVGIPAMVKLAKELGVTSLTYDPRVHWLAITLGGSEVRLIDLTNGYASLADGGRFRDVHAILEVKDARGKTLEKYNDFGGKQVVDEKLVYVLTTILSDNNARAQAFGSRSGLYIPDNQVAAKTGTSNDLKDNWTMGFTPDIAIGVWVGNNDGQPMNPNLSSGLTGAAPIWHKAMQYFLKDHPNKEFPRPDGIKEVQVGTESGMLPYENEPTRTEYYAEGTEPKSKSSIYQKIQVCDEGDLEERTYTVYKAEKPDWQKFVDDWVKDKFKDDEKQLNRHTDPEVLKKDDENLFDIENCDSHKKDKNN